MNPDDERVVADQLGRAPRGRCRVATRCPHGFPQVIAVAPLLEGGAPFPTTFWLTCPWLVERVHALESDGAHRQLAATVADDAALSVRALAADSAYRSARSLEGGGVDPCGDVGMAGQLDALAVKCLHARLAAFLVGIDDPVGERVRSLLESEGAALHCADLRCVPDVGAS